jgi:cellulose synthase (UDP-forming)
MPAAIKRSSGHLFSCTLSDYANSGVGIRLHAAHGLSHNQHIMLLLKRGAKEYAFPARVMRVQNDHVGLQLEEMTPRQNIDFMQCTFARADTWALWQKDYPEDKPLKNLFFIFKLGFRGYRQLTDFAPAPVKYILRFMSQLMSWIYSFCPRISPGVSQEPLAESALIQP